MDEIQRKHEQAAGDVFVGWYNLQDRKRFVYDQRPRETPDVGYVAGGDVLNVENTDAYYDKNDAEMQWKTARRKTDAPIRWSGTNLDQALVADISARIAEKSFKDYGRNWVLVICI